MRWLWAAVLLCTGPLHAKPAPWYWWRSHLNGQMVCAQFMPSAGWQRGSAAFDNAQCVARPHVQQPWR